MNGSFCFLLFLLFFFFRAFVVDDLHMLGGDEGDAVFLCPGDATFEDERKEYARYGEDGHQCFVREFDNVIHAVGGVAYRLDRRLPHLEKFGSHTAFSVEPEILTVAVAVIDGERWEILCFDAVYDGIAVSLLHKNLVDLQNEVCAEF